MDFNDLMNTKTKVYDCEDYSEYKVEKTTEVMEKFKEIDYQYITISKEESRKGKVDVVYSRIEDKITQLHNEGLTLTSFETLKSIDGFEKNLKNEIKKSLKILKHSYSRYSNEIGSSNIEFKTNVLNLIGRSLSYITN